VDFATNPVDGVRIAYRTFGTTGPAVVLVHGTGLSQVIWRGFGYVRDLAGDHVVVTPDLRGHGRSEKPHDEDAYRPERFTGDVLAVLDRLGIERAGYVGYSLGGRVGFSLVDTVPERVSRFASVAGAAGIQAGAFDRVFFPACRVAIESGGMAGFLEQWQEWNGVPLDAQTRAAFAANDPVALAAYMRAAEQDRGVPPEHLKTWRTPTLLLVGAADAERVDAARDAAASVPGARLEVLPGVGHGDVLRQADTMTAIHDFLAAGSSGWAALNHPT
jgi:pimeloyl-ACP methyl ester carboxylesterase